MADLDILDATRNTFFDECAELLGVTEAGLELLANGAFDSETLHGIFRAVHSIKGGAGAFRFVELVNFAHVFETALDALREGRISPDPAVVGVLLRATDVLSDLVTAARDGIAPGEGFGGDVAAALSDLVGRPPPKAEPAGARHEIFADASPPADGGPGSYRITFTPHEGLLRRANEPLLLIRDLKRLGTVRVHADHSRIPPLDRLQTDAAYLAWVLDIETAAREAELRDVFEFVLDDCDLRIDALLPDAASGVADGAALPQTPAPPLAPSSPDAPPAAASGAAEISIGVKDDKVDLVISLTRDLWAFYVEQVANDAAAAAPVASAMVRIEARKTPGATVAVPAPATPPGDAASRKAASAPPPRSIGDDQERARVAEPASAAAAPTTAAPQSAPADSGPVLAASSGSIRVDLEKIDRLVNLAGELVITQAMLTQQVGALSVDQYGAILGSVGQLTQHTRELQESVMAIRAQPIKSVFARIPRVVREAATLLGKDVRLVTSGENTEIDRTVIERLGDPLTHMIRNAVDHGIETPEEREAKGKPRHGTVHLSAEQRGSRIVIEITDDGRGIDREKVLRKAERAGLVAPGAVLSDAEIDNLIFSPGLSTAATVSSISGRGVGMDVVKRSLQNLGGRVSIESIPNSGSRFTLSLPLTLAVVDGMVVAVGAETYIVPIANIVESIRPRPADVHRLAGRGKVVSIRGEYVPLVFLHQMFGIAGAIADPSAGLVIIVEADGGGRVGLVVDELLGQQQVVLKSLEANYESVEGIAAATILGNGQVALILDVSGLRASTEQPQRPLLAPASAALN